MITIIGTGHVFDLSTQLINIFDEKQPDILCIELDKQRFQGLMLRKNNPEKYKQATKDQPILYKLLSRFQEGMANEYGVQAGEEMMITANYAQSHQLPLALIDMNAQMLFQKMLKSMSMKEKIKGLFSAVGSVFINKKRVEKELDNIHENYDTYIDQMEKNFPTIKKILIDDRNKYMVNKIILASEKHENVIAVVGDGHVPGLADLLKQKEIEFETIRLSELRNKKPRQVDPSSASFSIKHDEM